jgi:DNA-binding response OmpR family regulator
VENLKILVVEDEVKISEVVKSFLEAENYEVIQAYDGIEAMELFGSEEVQLVILDLMLPKLSGEEVCRKIRSQSDVPIIMVTAKVEEEERIEGLSIGADDYVIKPFSVKELVQRVKTLLRRSYSDGPKAEKYNFNDGDVEVDLSSGIVLKNGTDVGLTGSELKVLKTFLANLGSILSRDQLIEKSFGYDYDGNDRTIDAHIKNIRHKIESNPKDPEYILTVYGMGYRFGVKR